MVITIAISRVILCLTEITLIKTTSYFLSTGPPKFVGLITRLKQNPEIQRLISCFRNISHYVQHKNVNFSNIRLATLLLDS